MTRVSLFVLSMAMLSTSAWAEARVSYNCDIPPIGKTAIVFLNMAPTVGVLMAQKGADGVLVAYETYESVLTADKDATLTYVGRIAGIAAAFQLSEPDVDGHMTGTFTLAGFGPLPPCTGGLSPPPDDSDWNAPVPEFPNGGRP